MQQSCFYRQARSFSSICEKEFAKALTVKNYYGQNPLHILLQHFYVYAERRGRPSYMGTDTSTTIKQALHCKFLYQVELL